MLLKRTIFLLCAILSLAPVATAQQTVLAVDTKEIDTEKLSKVKAAFLLNFLKFTTWPETRFENANAPFKLVLVGDDDIGNVLDATLRGRDWHGHPITIIRVESNMRIDPASIHVVYIAPSSGFSIEDIQTMIRSGILVIGYDRNMVKNGSMLGFSIEDGKVCFGYNVT